MDRQAATAMPDHRCILPAALLLALLLPSLVAFAAGERELLAGASKSCPGCALEGAALKRRDLSDADLTGANLARGAASGAAAARQAHRRQPDRRQSQQDRS